MRTLLVSALLASALVPVSSFASSILPSPYIDLVIDLQPSAQCEQNLARIKSLVEEAIPSHARGIIVPLCLLSAPGDGLQTGRVSLQLSNFEDLPRLSERLKLLNLRMSFQVSAAWFYAG